jgi:hypothetical protein
MGLLFMNNCSFEEQDGITLISPPFCHLSHFDYKDDKKNAGKQ